MNIAIVGTGSRGDVQPYIALGKGLINAGFRVRFVSHQNYENLVTSHGLEFWPVDHDVQAVVQENKMQASIEKGNFLSLMAQMAKEAQQGAIRLAEAGLAACQGMDLLLAGMGGVYIGLALADKLNIPLLQAYLLPFTPTQEFASVLISKQPAWFRGSMNRFSHHLTRQLLWQSFRSADKLARQEVLKMPPAPFSGPYNSVRTSGLPILYGFSPSVIAPPTDWDKNIHVTGYWFLDASDDWIPSSELIDFLDSGSPPVYIGFGSMSNRNPVETADLVLEALRRSHQRAILLSGWGGLQGSDLPDTVFMIDSVPHAWLFPRMAAVVHHGGAGTTAAGLRAGVPSVIVPFFGDQPFWGQRIADLGVGPDPIPRKKLTVEQLAKAIQIVISDKEMHQRAARLGEQIRTEDGITRAVEIIRQIEMERATGFRIDR